MTSTFLSYSLWAFIQHTIMLISCWIIPDYVVTSVALSMVLFPLIHFPNFKLMAVTLVAAIFIYFTFGILLLEFGLISLLWFIPVSFIHGYIGRHLLENGWDLRVLWLHSNWNLIFGTRLIK